MTRGFNRFLDFARSLRIPAPILCDVGSRDASEAILLFHELGARELHLFEPNPEAVARCRRNLSVRLSREELRAVKVNPAAASDVDGSARFYPVDVERSENPDIGFSSLFRLNPEYMKRRATIVQKEIRVETVRLDTYFQDRAKPDILWIDVEGAELQVLKGASSVLRQAGLLHIEVSFRPMQIGKPLFWKVDSFLRESGFRLEFFPDFGFLKGFLYRKRLLPNPPWRVDAVYRRRTDGS